MRTRNVLVGSSLIALVAALGIAQQQLERTASAQSKAAVQAPRFEVDPMWPKPMPNHWLLGNTIGVGVDIRDHVCIIHRGAPRWIRRRVYATANPPAVRVLRRPRRRCSSSIAEGNLVQSWGGPGQGYEWPESNHGITLDSKGNRLDRRQRR